MRIVVLSADLHGRSTLVLALEHGGCTVVGEGRTAEDGRRLAPGCDVLLVDDDALAVTLEGTVRRPVVRIAPPGMTGEADVLQLTWPADAGALQTSLRRLDAILPPAGARSPAVDRHAPASVTGPVSWTGIPATGSPATRPTSAAPPLPRLPLPRPSRPRIVVVGASAGGPATVASLLTALGPLPIPVVIAQHLHPDFALSLRAFLARATDLPIAIATAGMPLVGGTVALAGPGGDLVVTSDGQCAVRPTSSLHVPSIDVLLRSVAAAYGAAAIGVILTGMGQDGADGLMAMRERGALTIAQDQATSTVFGMPAAAAVSGAASVVLPLDAIGPAISSTLGPAAW